MEECSYFVSNVLVQIRHVFLLIYLLVLSLLKLRSVGIFWNKKKSNPNKGSFLNNNIDIYIYLLPNLWILFMLFYNLAWITFCWWCWLWFSNLHNVLTRDCEKWEHRKVSATRLATLSLGLVLEIYTQERTMYNLKDGIVYCAKCLISCLFSICFCFGWFYE